MSKKKADDPLVELEAQTVSMSPLVVSVDVNGLLESRSEAHVFQFLANLKDLLRG